MKKLLKKRLMMNLMKLSLKKISLMNLNLIKKSLQKMMQRILHMRMQVMWQRRTFPSLMQMMWKVMKDKVFGLTVMPI